MTAHPPAAVVFDLDGVLVESEHLWEEMWSRHAARSGGAWTAADTADVQGMSAPEWSAYLAGRTGTAAPVVEAAVVEAAVVDDMVAALDAGRIEPYPGATAMVREIAARVPVALATSAPRRLLDAVLLHHGLAPSFTATVSSAEVARGKPGPDVYLAAAATLGVPAGNCVAVEDSANGLRAAHAAGMTVVAIPHPLYPPAPAALALATRVADGVPAAHRELLALLDGVPTGTGAAR